MVVDFASVEERIEISFNKVDPDIGKIDNHSDFGHSHFNPLPRYKQTPPKFVLKLMIGEVLIFLIDVF